MGRKSAGMTVDFIDDMLTITFTEEKIRQLLQMLKREGFQRVFWYDYPAHTGWFRDCGVFGKILNSLPHVPNHAEIAVREGKALGLEMYVTYKPYEEGGLFSFPPGSEMDRKYGKLQRLGGRPALCTEWLLQHPEMRVRRRMEEIPPDVDQKVIDRIEIDKADDVPSGLAKGDLRLYVSRDNARYAEYSGRWEFKEETVPALLLDYFGQQINTETRKTRRITLSGLRLGPEWKYVAVDAGEKGAAFKSIPMTMCRVYDPEGKLIPVTFAVKSGERKPDPYAVSQGISSGGFIENGFEYDAVGYAMGCSGAYYLNQPRPLMLGITRGVNEYLAGAVCEAYPEVRQHWMEEIRRILSYGPDGIEIRIANHSSDTQDPFAYGFNEPVLEEYRRLEKADAVAYDPVKIMRIRGAFFTRFLAEASAAIHAAGKRVQAQVIAPYASGNVRAMANRSFCGVWPDWEEWVRRYADAITFRDFLAEFYNPRFDQVIKPFARSLNREVWAPAYFTMSFNNVNDTYLQAVERDEEITGVMFYESWEIYEERGGRFEMKPEFAEPVRRFMKRNQ